MLTTNCSSFCSSKGEVDHKIWSLKIWLVCMRSQKQENALLLISFIVFDESDEQ